MAEMLKIDHICKTFNAGTINEKVALNGVDLTLEDGDFVTVIGGNGAGKSTTLNAVAGVWPVDSGKIFIGGDDVTKLSEYKRAKYLGRVFQDPMTGTATTMSIEENMAIAARRGRKRGLSWGITKAERDTYREMLKTLDLGLEDRLTSKVVSAWSEVMARLRKCPVTSYLLVALFPLVPGGGIYYTMEHALNGDTELFLDTLMHTLGLAGALAVGVLLVASVVRLFTTYQSRRRG